MLERYWLFAGFDYESWGAIGGMYSFWGEFSTPEEALKELNEGDNVDGAHLQEVVNNSPGRIWEHDPDSNSWVEWKKE